MRKTRAILGVTLFVIVAVAISIFCEGPLVKYSSAIGPCYYCAWHNQYQMYECKLYMGPGYSGCEAEGTNCEGSGTCGIET